jgi:GH24 family phage-related lysozyme (muramidase)
MDGGDDGRAAARGEALRRWQNRGAEVQKGLRGRRKEGKVPED